MKLIKYRQECTLLQFKRMNQLMHIYYSQPVGYKVCNKLLDYTPEYENNGVTIRRHVTPYFGLEMNVKI